jgi:uncharacterized membrane protein (DUF485 family)
MEQQDQGRVHRILASPEFKKLVATRWGFSLAMTAVMLVVYFGFILAVGFGKEALSARLGTHLNVGLVLGLGVIVFAWAMTGLYVYWANGRYDARVRQLVKHLHDEADHSNGAAPAKSTSLFRH